VLTVYLKTASNDAKTASWLFLKIW